MKFAKDLIYRFKKRSRSSKRHFEYRNADSEEVKKATRSVIKQYGPTLKELAKY